MPLKPHMQVALLIYTMVLCKQFTTDELIAMADKLKKGIRPDTFNGGGLERFTNEECAELLRPIIAGRNRHEGQDL